MAKLSYGPVFFSAGSLKGRILYYDDDATSRTAICYAGHPIDFVGTYDVQKRYLRDPTIDELLNRREAIHRMLNEIAIDDDWDSVEPERVHQLWSERSLIDEELLNRRMFDKLGPVDPGHEVFLCHSSADKGRVRILHDDLAHRGVKCWLDENKIKVGDSIVSKIDEGLSSSKTMIIFLSRASVKSLWTRKEWQAFLAKKLRGKDLKLLPALLDECEVPDILADIKYADFRESYYDGFRDIHDALT